MTNWATFDQRLIAKRPSIVTGFLELLRRNTVSQNPDGVRAGGEWLAALMKSRGLDARVLETGGGPAVFGERRVPGAARTVLIYCHYDTKPAPAAAWFQPSPFEPVFRTLGDADDATAVSFERLAEEDLLDWRVYARGASDDKGPIWSHLEALALMDELGLPPAVNVKFIFDGEEEIGSPCFGPSRAWPPPTARRSSKGSRTAWSRPPRRSESSWPAFPSTCPLSSATWA